MVLGSVLTLALATAAFAQHGRTPGVGPIAHGFGNVVFPGTGIPRATGHIPNLSSTIRGVYPAAPVQAGQRGGIYPVAVPVFVGGYGFGYGYTPTAQPAPNVTVINAPPQQPTVIINQHWVPDQPRPVVRDYSSEPLPETVRSYQAPVPSNPDPPKKASVDDDKPTIYLIAMRDGTVYSAYAYWLEGDTLHYITTKHGHNQATLDLVDAGLSTQLNRERGLEFKLRK